MFAAEPGVDIYMIRKMDLHAPGADFPQIIIEICNPTKDTFYLSGGRIESPIYHTEALRKGKWLRIPNITSDLNDVSYPLKPGAKLSAQLPFHMRSGLSGIASSFWRTEKRDEMMVTVLTRAIERKELGDLAGTIGELDSDKPLEETYHPDRSNRITGSHPTPGLIRFRMTACRATHPRNQANQARMSTAHQPGSHQTNTEQRRRCHRSDVGLRKINYETRTNIPCHAGDFRIGVSPRIDVGEAASLPHWNRVRFSDSHRRCAVCDNVGGS